MKVKLVQDGRLWCLWWLDPPNTYQWDRPGVPSSPYLCGYLARQDAVDAAAREGWEVAG